MRFKDIYDDMPDGAAQRSYNEERLAELERDGEARRARIALVRRHEEVNRLIIQPMSPHVL